MKEEDSRKADASMIEKPDKSLKTSPILRKIFRNITAFLTGEDKWQFRKASGLKSMGLREL